jgi:hypothetical protein
MNTRVDLYTPIHKAIRSVLFSTTATFARTDLADEADAREALQGVQRLIEILRDHAEHEDSHVMPLLATLDGTVAESRREPPGRVRLPRRRGQAPRQHHHPRGLPQPGRAVL